MIAAGLLAGLCLPAQAQSAASSWFETDQGRVRLIAAAPAVGDGATIRLGLEFQLHPHWKIYWRSPGDAGYPPRLDWTGSRNLAGATIAWPAPQRFSVLGLETMGYTDAVVLPISARLQHAGQALNLSATLDYLTCDDICIPYQTRLHLDLPAGNAASGAAGYAALIAQYEALVPGDGAAAGLHLAGAAIEPGSHPALLLKIVSNAPLAQPDAFIEGPHDVAFNAPKAEAGAAGETLLRLAIEGDAKAVAGLTAQSLTVTLVDGARAMEASVTPILGPPAGPEVSTWLVMLGLALAGGFILNFMPCVLPVLALKFLGVVASAKRPARAVRFGFLASAAGIVASFLALAGFALILRAAGMYVGWGLQFQSPLFLVAMTAILALFAANLAGFFELPLPRGFARLGESRALLGSFFTGVLATLLATPCSAPLLGTALGFALAAGPIEILAIFFTMGVGLALPYLAVAVVPGVARLLPKPGNWMVELRRVLGLALAASALWLLWVLAAEAGMAAAVVVAALLIAAVLALALLRTPAARRGAVILALALAFVAPGLFAAPMPAALPEGPWQAFDAAAIPDLVAHGKVVMVDVTADWCLTCKVNERLVLGQAAMRRRLASPGIIAMRADWTRPNAAIAAYLRGFGRYGIPFNAVYGPATPVGEALPEILTPERVTAALDRAAGGDYHPR